MRKYFVELSINTSLYGCSEFSASEESGPSCCHIGLYAVHPDICLPPCWAVNLSAGCALQAVWPLRAFGDFPISAFPLNKSAGTADVHGHTQLFFLMWVSGIGHGSQACTPSTFEGLAIWLAWWTTLSSLTVLVICTIPSTRWPTKINFLCFG